MGTRSKATVRRPTADVGLALDRAPELADLFKLLGDPTRLKVVLSCVGTPMSVSTIADQLTLSASLVSHHLRLLRAARIVRSRRSGKQVFYCAADNHVRRVVRDMLEHITELDVAGE